MAYQHLILLAPCHGLEDFPLYHTGDAAASLLAGWTSLWHPTLLHAAGRLPRVERCDNAPDSIQQALLVLPTPCETELDADLPTRAAGQGATLIRGLNSREAILEQALSPLVEASREIDQDLARDFLALGFVYLQVRLLTQQMRYASSLDDEHIETLVLAAAQAVANNELETCREKLRSCFDALTDERSHYYPVDVYLLDLTLLAPTTLSGDLERQLADSTPQNFLADGLTVRELAEQGAPLLASLRAALEANRAGLAGGEYQELPLPLMSYDSALQQLKRGAAVYRDHLGRAPDAYGRRKNGMFAGLSQLIQHMGFSAALHFAWDEGRYPETNQSKAKWETSAGDLIDVLARRPLDAARHETFLNLPTQLCESMDMDHVATRMFVHWPGRIAPWYEDLRRAARYGTSLGRFVTLREFFTDSGDASGRDAISSDHYRRPYLTQDVRATRGDPVSRWTHYWQAAAELVAGRGAWLIRESLVGATPESSPSDPWEERADGLDQMLDPRRGASSAKQAAEFRTAREAACQAIASAVAADAADENSLTIVNTLSFPRRVVVDTSAWATGPEGEQVYAASVEPDGAALTVVDVPAMGFARIAAGRQPKRTLPGPLLIEDLTLRNEFFQAHVSRETGALRSLTDYRSRGTRLSQQLALRIAVPKTGQPWIDRQNVASYTSMQADRVEVTRNGRIQAEITASGRLCDVNGEVLGEFTQRFQITRGSRILVVEIELTPRTALLDDPWESYFACRFAWADEAALLRGGARWQSQEMERKRIEAPLFVDIESGTQHTTVLSGGLPYHRRISPKQLDTLLLAAGEQAAEFRLGVGVDLPSAPRAALDFLAGPAPAVATGSPPGSGWFFHLDAKNVLATCWQPLAAPQRGFQVRLLETEGRAANVRVQAIRPLESAYLVDGQGEPIRELKIDGGAAEVHLHAYQFAEVQAHW